MIRLLRFALLIGLVVVAAPAAADSPIKDDEELVLLPTAAHRAGTEWVVPVHGWIFEPEDDSLWRGGLLAGLREALDLDADDARAARFAEVARWFLVDNERGKALEVAVAGRRWVLPESGKDGHTRATVRVAAGKGGDWLTVKARARDGRTFTGRAQLVAPTGVSVVSDVDDTIKITEVLAGHRRVLERTFVEPFEAVAGMAARYQAWADAGAVFHYVSASPWHIYPLLAGFLGDAGFPPGTFALREFRLKDERRWDLLASSRPHKLAAIEALMARFPRRRFVLVGDSGESDPEIYGELARRHPRQVAAIAIRRLAGDRYAPARVQRAFAGVTARVIAFERAAELPGLADLIR